jgi:glycosyltransferase involved in cell wall biosynthesis
VHIVHVTHAYPRWDGDMAGIFLERLAVAQRGRGHRVTVVAPADVGSAGEDDRSGVTVRRVRYAPSRWETLAYRGTMVEAVRSLRGVASAGGLVGALAAATVREVWQRGVDVVHAHWWIPGGLSAWLGATVPYVVTLHGTDVALLGRSRAARMVAAAVLRRANRVSAVSSYLAAQAAGALGLRPEALAVQAMPVDVDRFTQGSSGGGGVVTVGRLTAQKQVSTLIDAMAWLRDQGRAMRLTVVGDGPERDALVRRAARAGIDSLTTFLGTVPPERIPEVLRTADVFAFAAVGEGLGLAVAEALMLGVPVAAARSGGVTDLVPEGEAGRLVPPGDSEAMGQAIAQLLDEGATAREAAASVGRDLRDKLRPDSVACAYEPLYAVVGGTTGEAGRA